MSRPVPLEPAVAARIALAREHLAAGRALTLRAEGHSMWPLIQDGELVVVRPLERALAVGDVVLVVHAARLVLHRVVRLAPEGVVTKGDSVARVDGLIALGDVLGALPRSSPVFHRVVATLSSKAARPLTFVLQRTRLAVSRIGC